MKVLRRRLARHWLRLKTYLGAGRVLFELRRDLGPPIPNCGAWSWRTPGGILVTYWGTPVVTQTSPNKNLKVYFDGGKKTAAFDLGTRQGRRDATRTLDATP